MILAHGAMNMWGECHLIKIHFGLYWVFRWWYVVWSGQIKFHCMVFRLWLCLKFNPYKWILPSLTIAYYYFLCVIRNLAGEISQEYAKRQVRNQCYISFLYEKKPWNATKILNSWQIIDTFFFVFFRITFISVKK